MKFTWRAALFSLSVLTATSVAPAEVTSEKGIMPVTDTMDGPTVAMPEMDELLRADVTGEPVVEEEAALPEDLHDLVQHFAGTDPRDRQMECLAGAIYFETRGESLEGQLAVGRVIANRAESSRFPNTYCGVVYQRSQFSFVRGGKMPHIKRGSRAWQRAVAVARIVDGEHHDTHVNDALFFHARYVNPGWRLKRVGTIGNHIFYR